jgi:hypothetical protein
MGNIYSFISDITIIYCSNQKGVIIACIWQISYSSVIVTIDVYDGGSKMLPPSW